ncbi:MAG: hypothetical protein K2I73_07040 [Eubacterium sp.]|nr:hypothetical protein [Eubacterium sp.]
MEKIMQEILGYFKDMFKQKNTTRRIVISLFSIIIMGLGISLFSVSGFGVDPFTSMNMNIASALNLRFGTYQLIVNAVILLYVILVAHRGLVGIGTVFNMVGCGYACEFFQNIFEPFAQQNYTMPFRIFLLIIGIITLCFACSLFFTANVGVGPYDAVGFMLSRGIKLSHKWVRVITDVTVIMIGLAVSGGLAAIFSGNFENIKNIGIGTIITAFCMGPLINVFNKTISAKILNVNYEKVGKECFVYLLKDAEMHSFSENAMFVLTK